MSKNSVIRKFSTEANADICVLSGPITRDIAKNFLDQATRSKHHDHVNLILATYGGDPDAAYIIARYLQSHYASFSLYVFGYCKSAGTLIALAADEIIMSTFGELGPLDVQLIKQDEVMSRSSGLDIFQAVDVINNQVFTAFEQHLLELKRASGGNITMKTASEIAATLSTGLFSQITGQIDPQRLGETQRAIQITEAYGRRLGADEEILSSLIFDYPTHSFVIDFEEAQALFGHVRRPNTLEVMATAELKALLFQQFGVDCVETPHHSGFVAFYQAVLDESASDDTLNWGYDELEDSKFEDSNLNEEDLDESWQEEVHQEQEENGDDDESEIPLPDAASADG